MVVLKVSRLFRITITSSYPPVRHAHVCSSFSQSVLRVAKKVTRVRKTGTVSASL
jgi:hypothetical protein